MNIDFLRKNKLLFAILIITMMLLSACAGKDGIKTPENTVNSSTSTITDGNGNSVIIPSEVKRIAAAGALNQIILMLGGGDKLVATAQGVQTGFFTKVYPRIKEIPAAYTGGGPGVLNMETLLQTHPEVLFGTAANEAEAETLKSANIATVSLKLVTTEDIKNTIALVGKVLGPKAEEKATAFNSYYDANIKYASDKSKGLNKVKVFVAGGDGLNGTISTTPKEDINTSYIEAAGGVNVCADTYTSGSPTVNIEQVLKWDPDVIIASSRAVYESIIAQDSIWKDLWAVKSKSVYLNPKGVYLWSVRSAEGALQPLWLIKVLHPELCKDLDLKEKVREFYKTYYYYDVTEADLDEILNPK
ncbi:MAG TPA: ABC transporter substrate-binding protein [Desulfitobacteriaceae bacterium]|jgi:iron complex transport system substrate-binding protein|nr:ABC transporter substrate-binding protein [Desulfitobacteriaceae bacterium]